MRGEGNDRRSGYSRRQTCSPLHGRLLPSLVSSSATVTLLQPHCCGTRGWTSSPSASSFFSLLLLLLLSFFLNPLWLLFLRLLSNFSLPSSHFFTSSSSSPLCSTSPLTSLSFSVVGCLTRPDLKSLPQSPAGGAKPALPPSLPLHRSVYPTLSLKSTSSSLSFFSFFLFPPGLSQLMLLWVLLSSPPPPLMETPT